MYHSRWWIISTVVALLLFGAVTSHAQQADDADDLIPRGTIIFYDDFSEEAEGTFPKQWYSLPPKGGAPITDPNLCHISKTGQPAIVVSSGPAGSFRSVEPRMKDKDYLPDSFTLQYDIMVINTGTAGLQFRTTSQDLEPVPITIFKDGANWKIAIRLNVKSRTMDITSEMNEGSWHHFALTYYKRKLACYLDDTRILAMQDCGFDATSMKLGAELDAEVAFANVRLATGALLVGEHYDFSRLFSADKFTTHAIHFDVKQSTIRPESMLFIRKLANWLKQNPTVRMEINGHTDNDGDAAANMKLSQERADAVKNQLVEYGINALRLTTKGYGATIPIQPNTTPEGKADNRRVEFIKR